jgi:hypothetical protein
MYIWAWAARTGQPGPEIPGWAGSGLHVGPGSGLFFSPNVGPGRARACKKHDFSLVWARSGFSLFRPGLGPICKPKVGPGLARA